MGDTKNGILQDVTLNYLKDLDLNNMPNPREIEKEILNDVKMEFEIMNQSKAKGREWKIPETLTFSQIADIMLAIYSICTIACAGETTDPEYDLLAIYENEGANTGIYVTDELTFRRKAEQFNYNLTNNEFAEIMTVMRHRSKRKLRCDDKDLIAVNNGIFNYKDKELLPFSPDYVFMSKSKVDYNEYVTNPIIHNDEDNTDWDVESWMESLSDDPDIVKLLWEILGAVIRPNVRWNKSAWLYSTQGNNGKGTLCELLRSIVGAGSYTSIPISDFGTDFLLEPLIRSSAILVDENDVGAYIDKAANLKAVITNDVIQINRKHKTPIAYQFKGFMVQCLNEPPRIKDKSESFFRRLLVIPMTKCFTGREKKYIKDDYLHRKDVLEYVLYKLLNMYYYTLSEPQACLDALGEYKEFNDPVRQFFDEMSPQFVWDLLPFGFLYDLYKSWFKKNMPSGTLQSQKTFINDLRTIVASSYSNEWQALDNSDRSKNKMDKVEYLIVKYGLADWQNANYRGNDIAQICSPQLAEKYRGLKRIK